MELIFQGLQAAANERNNGLLLRKSPWGGAEAPLRAEARATKRAGRCRLFRSLLADHGAYGFEGVGLLRLLVGAQAGDAREADGDAGLVAGR